MLTLTPTMPILLSIKPTDFRKGIDSLIALCQQQLNQDPFSGTVFVFANKNRTAIKALIYDGTGFWLCLKRFSSGKLKWWPSSYHEQQSIRTIELHILFSQGHPRQVPLSEEWRKITSNKDPKD